MNTRDITTVQRSIRGTAEAQRRERDYVRLGSRTPRCRQCPETRPAALTGTAPNIVCYRCRAAANGKRPTEAHHVAGQHSDAMIVNVPANDHRVLSDMQRDWPFATLHNPDGSPLLIAAAAIRGWLDVLRLIIDRAAGWVPPFLESFDEWLRKQLGNEWWVQFAAWQVTP